MSESLGHPKPAGGTCHFRDAGTSPGLQQRGVGRGDPGLENQARAVLSALAAALKQLMSAFRKAWSSMGSPLWGRTILGSQVPDRRCRAFSVVIIIILGNLS